MDEQQTPTPPILPPDVIRPASPLRTAASSSTSPNNLPANPVQPPPNSASKQSSDHDHEGLKNILSTLLILIVAPLIALLLTAFVFQSYEVDGPSMESTLQNNDRLVVVKTELINNNSVQSIGLADDNVRLVQSFTAVNGTSAVRPVAGVEDFSQIKLYIKKLTSNDPVVKEGATAVVLNASGTPGLARKEADILTAKGITVKAVANASTDRATTAIVVPAAAATTSTKTSTGTSSAPPKPATKTYLEQKFKVTSTTDTTANPEARYYTADFVIILGKDDATTNVPN